MAQINVDEQDYNNQCGNFLEDDANQCNNFQAILEDDSKLLHEVQSCNKKLITDKVTAI